MPAPSRILVRAPNWVGDAVMATPALRALRRGFPDAEITVEARPYLRELLEPLAAVDRFLPCPGRGLSAMLARARTLRAIGFDLAVLLPDSQSAALGPFLARVPRRVGYARDVLRRALTTDPLPPPAADGHRTIVSMIERYLRITRHLGCPDDGDRMDVPVTDEARDAAAGRLAAAGVPEDARLLVAVPGASYGSSKLWPARSFARACDEVSLAHGLATVIAPGPGEEGVAAEVAAGASLPATVLADPVLGLGALPALVARAALVITNDTGPRQIAVALGVPTVVLIGPTDSRYTAHHLERQRILREDVDCSPCGLKRCPIDHRCMTRLRPERVVAAARELLTGSAPA